MVDGLVTDFAAWGFDQFPKPGSGAHHLGEFCDHTKAPCSSKGNLIGSRSTGYVDVGLKEVGGIELRFDGCQALEVFAIETLTAAPSPSATKLMYRVPMA